MKIFNTLTRRKEEFVPLEEGKVKMYVCGPTVYNLIHIGNARPMIIFDTVRRYMEYKGYEVNYVSNFTDVDDKIIKKAIEEGVSAEEISTRYIKECKKDMADMNVKPATTAPQATQEIQGMIDMIQTLIDKGYAYPAADGTVYFRVKKFKEYGKLSHKNLDDLQSGFRSLKVSGEDQKEDPLDFVLWKPKKEGEPSWPSPWCDGRPGWHIECSVMSKKYLGEEIDIHAGGEDLLSDDMSLLEAMEHGLEGDGRFIPVSIKTGKGEDEPTLAAKSAVADLAKFGRLARYTQKKLLEMGQALRNGSIEADPRKTDRSYCEWCDFRAACRFDETAGDKVRWLKNIKDKEFWEQLGGDDNAEVDT